MVIRKSSQGYNIRIHRNNMPGATRIRKYKDGSTLTTEHPSSYDYFITVEGSVVKKTNSFKVAEESYTEECAKEYENTHGRQVIGKHKMINKVITTREDYPTMSDVKDDIKKFLDIRSIKYDESSTKSDLIDIVNGLNPYYGLEWWKII